jgi:hypothetical protein
VPTIAPSRVSKIDSAPQKFACATFRNNILREFGGKLPQFAGNRVAIISAMTIWICAPKIAELLLIVPERGSLERIGDLE